MPSSGGLTDLQQRLLGLMKRFDALCRQHGIVYYLGGGSALGAVRHEGFLPWDDDVDLYITRSNYEKLLQQKESFFSDDFVLVNHDEFPLYGNTVVRCVNTRDAAITKARIVDGTPKGSFIELFVMDPMPRDPDEQDLWLRKHYVYADLLAVYFRLGNPRIDRSVDPALYEHYCQRSLQEGREEVLRELEDELFSISEEDSDEYCSRWGTRNLIYNIEWLQEPRYVPFEDTLLPVPTCAEEVLRFDYGDEWMYIPAFEDQVVHTYADSSTISYAHFVEDYTQFLDVDKLRATYAPRKRASINKYFIQRENHKSRLALQAVGVRASLANKHVALADLEESYRAARFEALAAHFEVWDAYQSSQVFWEWQEPLVLDDDELFLALIPQFMKGRYPKVRKILTWNLRDAGLGPRCACLLEAVDAVRDAYIAIDHGRYEEIKACLDRVAVVDISHIDQQYDYQYLGLFAASKACEKKGAVDSDVVQRAQALADVYPDKGEIAVLVADLLALSSNDSEALEWYGRAAQTTRHGFILRHALKRQSELSEGR